MQFVIIDDGMKYVTNPLKMGFMGSENKVNFRPFQYHLTPTLTIETLEKFSFLTLRITENLFLEMILSTRFFSIILI